MCTPTRTCLIPGRYPFRYGLQTAVIPSPTYAAMVTALDDEIGRVVAALDRKGLRENTLILFHSHNDETKNAMFSGVMADVSKIGIPCDNGPYKGGRGRSSRAAAGSAPARAGRVMSRRRPWTGWSTRWIST